VTAAARVLARSAAASMAGAAIGRDVVPARAVDQRELGVGVLDDHADHRLVEVELGDRGQDVGDGARDGEAARGRAGQRVARR
jgi:hypothetical protein